MRKLLNTTTIGILALIFPIAALANVTGTLTLNSGQNVGLDAGTVVSSGGDLNWNGTAFTPQGSATALNLTMFVGTGASTFNNLTQAELSALSIEYSTSAVTETSLGVGGILAVFTNGGNYSAILITAQSGTSVTFQYITFVSTVPTITAVVNNYGFTPAGFPNSGIALGTLFIISGSHLADPNVEAVLQNSQAAGGLPKTLNGASVSVTSGSTTVTPAFYYAISTALAVVLPSNTPLGTAQVTVTYGGQKSNAFSFQVVATAPGLDTYYGTANGLGVATNNSTGFLYNYNNSVPPTTIVTLWGSGLGADALRDVQYVTPPFAINGLAHVYVGGVDAQIIYQGASGFPGLNQVDITIPANAPTGCNVSVVGVTAAGQPTNFITLPIGSSPCSDPAFGVTGGTLSTLTGQESVNTGVVFLVQNTAPQQLSADRTGSLDAEPAAESATTVTDVAEAVFEHYTGSQYGGGGGLPSIGSCVVNQNLTGGAKGTTTPLNPGTVTVTGPVGSATLTSIGTELGGFLAGFYEAATCMDGSVPPSCLAAGFIPETGGTFTFNGSGGTSAATARPAAAGSTNIGAFNAQIVFPNPLLNWTNQSAAATITRSEGVLVTWTGGSDNTFVVIGGNSSSGTASGMFSCYAPVSAGSFMVPAYVTAAMPASSNGQLTVENFTNFTPFTAAGLDHAISAGYTAFEVDSVYQ
jgi:uncharacterized protein (TIGR03437 family)